MASAAVHSWRVAPTTPTLTVRLHISRCQAGRCAALRNSSASGIPGGHLVSELQTICGACMHRRVLLPAGVAAGLLRHLQAPQRGAELLLLCAAGPLCAVAGANLQFQECAPVTTSTGHALVLSSCRPHPLRQQAWAVWQSQCESLFPQFPFTLLSVVGSRRCPGCTTLVAQITNASSVRLPIFQCSSCACRSRIWPGCTTTQSRTIPSSAQHWGPTPRCCHRLT